MSLPKHPVREGICREFGITWFSPGGRNTHVDTYWEVLRRSFVKTALGQVPNLDDVSTQSRGLGLGDCFSEGLPFFGGASGVHRRLSGDDFKTPKPQQLAFLCKSPVRKFHRHPSPFREQFCGQLGFAPTWPEACVGNSVCVCHILSGTACRTVLENWCPSVLERLVNRVNVHP